MDRMNLSFGCTTKCCIIRIRKGNKYNTCCIYGKSTFFQGSGLVHTLTLCNPSETLITIHPTTKKEEAYQLFRLMKRSIDFWMKLYMEQPQGFKRKGQKH